MANVVTGPIIGAVDPRRCNLLFELDESVAVTIELRDLTTPVKRPLISLTPPAWRPAVAPLDNLVPGHRYRATINGVAGPAVAEFTAIDASKRLRIGVVSCNDAGYTPKTDEKDLWADLAAEVEAGDIDLVLHVGDQVYADGVYKDAVEWDEPPERVAKEYRSLYRRTWRRPPTRRVLAGVPNLMMWDDHEVVDNFGDLSEHLDGAAARSKDPAAAAKIRRQRRTAEIAWRIFREYQTPLHGGSAPGDPFGQESHGHVFGPVAIYLLDCRGGRAFKRDKQTPYLGLAQWKAFGDFLIRISKDPAVRVLVVVSPPPLVFLGPEWTDAHEWIIPNLLRNPKWPVDLRGHWSYGKNAVEQLRMLETLDVWRGGAPGRRVLLVGGDVHVGHVTTVSAVRQDGKQQPVFDQLTASSMSYRFLDNTEFWAYEGMLRNPTRGMMWNGHFHWQHRDLTWVHNYGVATITSGKAPRIDLALRT